MTKGAGDRFQQQTVYERGRMAEGQLDWANEPPAFKDYPHAPRIALAPAQTAEGPPFWALLQRRRSEREFARDRLAAADLSQLLWAAQGVTAMRLGRMFRTAPSAGALYPVETYVVAHAIEDLPPGLYHYDPREHALEQLRQADLRYELAHAALDQDMVYEAPLAFVWTALFQRSKWKYAQRAYRYVYLDAGHIAQNVALAAVGLGLGSCQVAAFYDSEMNALLGVDGANESALYLTVIGKPAE